MPSISITDGFTFTNIGPVTTTFTPQASCTTGTANVLFGIKPDSQPFGEFFAECSINGQYGCIPTGTVKPTLSDNANPTAFWVHSYYSPGLYCPSGWATVGIAAQDASKSLSFSGVLSTTSPTPTSTSSHRFPTHLIGFDNPLTLFYGLLDPGETAVMCCPSSMTAYAGWGCYSTVSDYDITTGCYISLPSSDYTTSIKTYTSDGSVTEVLVPKLISSNSITSTFSTTFDAEAISMLAAVSSMPMITLLHKPSDIKAAATTKAGNAAAGPHLTSDQWVGLRTMLMVSAAGAALGAAIIFV